jgi:NADH:ubiquinone oxidoreductase subunit 3 (subunit A)
MLHATARNMPRSGSRVTLARMIHARGPLHPPQEALVNGLGYLYAAIFFLGGCGFVLASLAFADMLNALFLRRRNQPSKLETYESGETPLGSAWVQYPLAFYIFALLFVAFDVDIVFILSWAVIFNQLSWFGFIEIVFFIGVLALGLVYAWRKGVIRWI